MSRKTLEYARSEQISRIHTLPIRAVTIDLWFTLVWDTKEMDEYWRLRRLINLHRFLKTKGGALRRSDVRIAIRELNTRIQRAKEKGVDVSTEERGRMLFQILGIKFSRHEEEKTEERAGAIISSSGSSAWLPNLNPEAAPMLKRLKEENPGIKIGLLSNAGRSSKTYARVLESLGIMKYFDSLTISCDVGFVKPHPSIFEHAVRSLSVKPSEVLHVGDFFKADIVGASTFGMNAALYTGLWHRFEPFTGSEAEHIPREFKTRRGLLLEQISNLNEIPDLIRTSR